MRSSEHCCNVRDANRLGGADACPRPGEGRPTEKTSAISTGRGSSPPLLFFRTIAVGKLKRRSFPSPSGASLRDLFQQVILALSGTPSLLLRILLLISSSHRVSRVTAMNSFSTESLSKFGHSSLHSSGGGVSRGAPGGSPPAPAHHPQAPDMHSLGPCHLRSTIQLQDLLFRTEAKDIDIDGVQIHGGIMAPTLRGRAETEWHPIHHKSAPPNSRSIRPARPPSGRQTLGPSRPVNRRLSPPARTEYFLAVAPKYHNLGAPPRLHSPTNRSAHLVLGLPSFARLVFVLPWSLANQLYIRSFPWDLPQSSRERAGHPRSFTQPSRLKLRGTRDRTIEQGAAVYYIYYHPQPDSA